MIKVTDRARAASAFGKFVGCPHPRARPEADPDRGRRVGVRRADAESAEADLLARGADRMVLAFGVAAAKQGIHPDRPLEQGASYAKAAEALGDGFTP